MSNELDPNSPLKALQSNAGFRHVGSSNMWKANHIMTAEEALAQPMGVLLVPDFVIRPGTGPLGAAVRAKARAEASFQRAQPNNIRPNMVAPAPLARFDRRALELLHVLRKTAA